MMRKFTLLLCLFAAAICGINAQTLIYSGASDPMQINGDVAEGAVHTEGEAVIFTGEWTSVTKTAGTGEDAKIKLACPANVDFRWKYTDDVNLNDGNARGMSFRYEGVAHDEFRCWVDTTASAGLVIFWCHWGEGFLAGGGTWTQTGVSYPGGTYTGPVIDIPDDAKAFRTTFDGSKYEVFYGQGETWVNVPELTLMEADFPLWGVRFDQEELLEFQINSQSGESRLDWLKIESDKIDSFNADVQVIDSLFNAPAVEIGKTNTLVYSGSSDPKQINGDVAEGAVHTDGESVIFTGEWTSVTKTAGTGEDAKIKLACPANVDFRWKYTDDMNLNDGNARGMSFRYEGVAHDEFRCWVDTTAAAGLVIFWCHWGEGFLAGGGTWKKTGVGYPGGNYSGPVVDIPDDAKTFRVTFDGKKYEVFYGKGDEVWVNVPELTLQEADFPIWGVRFDAEELLEFQINSQSGESRLDWLKIESAKIDNFNADVQVNDNLFNSDKIIVEEKTNILVYSGGSDPTQINGDVAEGAVHTDGETVIFTGEWTSVTKTAGTGEDAKIKLACPANVDFRWKYQDGVNLNDGKARGMSFRYEGVAHDEFRCWVDTTAAAGLVIFWCHWGEGFLAGGGTWKKTGVGYPGGNYTGPLVDIPDDTRTFRVTFDGTKYEVFYGQGDDGWVNVPELTLIEADFPIWGVRFDQEELLEFQINSESGESRLDWLKIESAKIDNFNADVQVNDNLFTTDKIIVVSSVTSRLKENLVKVYPNPFSDMITIEGKDLKNITIYNAFGQTIMEQNNIQSPRIQLNLNSLKSGLYFIKSIDRSNRASSLKIIKR